MIIAEPVDTGTEAIKHLTEDVSVPVWEDITAAATAADITPDFKKIAGSSKYYRVRGNPASSK